MSAVCLIPARSGSRRIPGKNIKLFHGKPIIAYSIETALESDLFDLVLVSTDSQEISDVAERYGAAVLMRDAEHSQDDVGTQEVARHVLDEMSENGLDFDSACVIYPTATMMTADDLRRGWEALDMEDVESETEHVFVLSVGDSPLQDAGQWYWGVAYCFGRCPLIGTLSMMYPIPKERVCDINTPDDFERAEKMYAAWKGL